MNEPVPITGIHLIRVHREGGLADLEVRAEVDGQWRTVITELDDGPASHIVEPAGILNAPLSDAH